MSWISVRPDLAYLSCTHNPIIEQSQEKNKDMTSEQIDIVVGKDITPVEFAALMASVGAGEEAAYFPEVVQRSLAAYPFVAHARRSDGTLVGYVSAFSDGAFSTFVGELAVHPTIQRRGVGRRLMQAVETYANGVPVYVNLFREEETFFGKLGYRPSQRAMSVLFKHTRVVEP
jgi:GNAT superfamily N-acetyltransferase